MRIKMMLGVFFIFLLSGQAGANEYVECNYCSPAMQSTAANTWVSKHTQPGASDPYTVNVVDLGRYQISTYSVSWKHIFLNDEADSSAAWATYNQQMPTSSEDQKYMDNLKKASDDYLSSLKKVEIPKKLIGEPWEVVNCAYCQNRVQLFLTETLEEQTTAVAKALGQLVSAFGLSDKLKITNTYRVTMEARGYMEIEIDVPTQSLMRATIKKVIDSDGNDIPFNAKDLKYLKIAVSDLVRNAAINEQINPLMYQIPPARTGVVVITESGVDTPTGTR